MQLKGFVYPDSLKEDSGANNLAVRSSTSLLESISGLFSSAVGLPFEFITWVRPVLIGLYAAHYETRRYQSTIGLHALYQAEEFIHLIHVILAR